MILLDTNDLRELLDAAGVDPVLTLYLPVDTTDPANHRDVGSRSWEVQLRNDLHEIARNVEEAEAERFAQTRAAVEQWMAAYHPGGRTLVLVASPDRVIDIELPIRLAQRSAYGRPAVAELSRAVSEHRLYGMLLVDGETARLLVGALGFVDDLVALQVDNRWGEPGPTRSRHQFRFESRREEYQAKHQRSIAEQADRFLEQFPEVDRLVLGGNAVEAHGVARALGARATRALLGVIPCPVDIADNDLLQRVSAVAEQAETDADRAVVAELHAAAARGRAVFGMQAVIDALSSRVVREVVISSHLEISDALEDLVRSAIVGGATVVFAHQDAADDLDATDGVAAGLYYAAVVVP